MALVCPKARKTRHDLQEYSPLNDLHYVSKRQVCTQGAAIMEK